MYTRVERKKLRDEYVTGRGAISEIAERHGVRRQTVARWAAADGWEELRTLIEQESNAIATASLSRELAAHNARVFKAWSDFLDAVEDRLRQPVGIEARDLAALATIVEKVQRGQRISLNADLPGEGEPQTLHVVYQSLREAITASGQDAEGTNHAPASQ